MTLFDGVLIFLVGMWPIIIPISIVLCVFVYSRTKSIGWVAFISVVTLVLLIPSLVYFRARMENRRILGSEPAYSASSHLTELSFQARFTRSPGENCVPRGAKTRTSRPPAFTT